MTPTEMLALAEERLNAARKAKESNNTADTREEYKQAWDSRALAYVAVHGLPKQSRPSNRAGKRQQAEMRAMHARGRR